MPAPPAAPTAAPVLDVESCELVDVGDGDALLRLSGRWSPEPPQRLDLVSFGDGAIERIEPLPPGASVGADGIWHVAFCVADTATGAHLALMTPAGAAIGLPTPTRLHSAPVEPPADQQELAVEREARAEAEERLAHALEDLSDAEALVDQFRRRCELSERGLVEFRDKLVSAWGEAASMRDMLDEREAAHEAAKQRAREADEVVAEVEARARRSRRELATRRDELEAQCARLQAELEQREASELSAAEQLAATEALRAEAADALTRFEAARAEADSLESQLAEAQQLADEATAATARAAREILEERQKTDEAAHQADVYSERLAKAERELAETREEFERAQAQADEAGGLVEALEAESARADEATRRVEEAQRELTEARTELEQLNDHVKTLEADVAETNAGAAAELAAERARAEEASNRAQAAEQKLAAETARADEVARRTAEAEWQLAEAREQLAKAGAAGERTPAQAVVETDLRHLLEKRERELEAARAELAEQRTRYAAVASEVPPAEEPPADAIAGENAEPWSRVDEDLLERLARAKSLAGQD